MTLAVRNLMHDLRSAGESTRGPPPFSPRDRFPPFSRRSMRRSGACNARDPTLARGSAGPLLIDLGPSGSHLAFRLASTACPAQYTAHGPSPHSTQGHCVDLRRHALVAGVELAVSAGERGAWSAATGRANRHCFGHCRRADRVPPGGRASCSRGPRYDICRRNPISPAWPDPRLCRGGPRSRRSSPSGALPAGATRARRR